MCLCNIIFDCLIILVSVFVKSGLKFWSGVCFCINKCVFELSCCSILVSLIVMYFVLIIVIFLGSFFNVKKLFEVMLNFVFGMEGSVGLLFVVIKI